MKIGVPENLENASLKINFNLEQVTKTQRGVEVQLYSLTLAVDGGGRSTPRPGCCTLGKKARYPLYKTVGESPGKVWTGAENLAATGNRSPERPAHSESLYRLSYREPLCVISQKS
jgi:hypothetical protein